MDLDQLFGDLSRRDNPLPDFLSSHESTNRRVRLFSNLVAVADVRCGWMLAPMDYQDTAEAHPEGLVRGKWRPQLYYFYDDCWHCQSSQRELWWRWATANKPWREAEEKAKSTLLDQLTEHQMAEYALTGNFTIRGGLTGNTYVIRSGNGFAIINPSTRVELVSYCFHPEYWMPDDDVSLATKLALECPETEARVLTRATAYIQRSLGRSAMGDLAMARRYPEPRKPTAIERYAADMERELL